MSLGRLTGLTAGQGSIFERAHGHKPFGSSSFQKGLSFLGILCRFFQDRGIDVKVEYSWGATEVRTRFFYASRLAGLG